MRILDLFKSSIDTILLNAKKELYNNKLVKEVLKDENIDEVLEKQKEIIYKYINFNKDSLDKDFEEFYKKLNIPFYIIYSSLVSIKKEILKCLYNYGVSEKEILIFSSYFEYFIENVAKIYLKKEIYELEEIKNSSFKDFLLYKSVIEFIDKIIKSVEIKNPTINNFPIINHKECDFYKRLYSLDGFLICIDKSFCEYLKEIHKTLHKNVNTFFSFYIKNKFVESYFLFKDFKELTFKLLNIINELYFTAYSDIEKPFFKLLTTLKKEENVFFSVINIKSLKSLNEIYTEVKINKALKEIESTLHKHCFKNGFLCVRGIGYNFYILHTNIDENEYKKSINNLFELINNRQFNKIKFNIKIYGMKIKVFSPYNENDLLKIPTILKKFAKGDIFLVLKDEEIEKINKEIYKKYNKGFIKEKILKKEIEVVFHPIHKTNTKEVFALEVLGRIVDEDKLVPAGMFIDDIYEMKIIKDFDEVVLEKILEKKELIKEVSNRVFINISFESLLSEDYIKKLESFIHDMQDFEIILEMTEQKFMEHLDEVINLNKKYKIYFAVDDFGSGFSSFKTVAEMVKSNILKVLKIDGSLVSSIENDEILRKIIKVIAVMGKELYLLTVAEFVENENVINILKSENIELLQGFFLSEPKMIEDLIIEKKEGFLF